MKQKKIPMRNCKGCNEMKPKKELIRIVKSPEGEISLDLTGKKNGRGAYICDNPECIARLKKQKLLNKVFSTAVDDEVYAKIEEEFLARKN
ncbi:MAG: YlxR family protein [Oscillospiraceae bacterium]|nr:YlxR family protein [Oscillospiraceae bacterium]